LFLTNVFYYIFLLYIKVNIILTVIAVVVRNLVENHEKHFGRQDFRICGDCGKKRSNYTFFDGEKVSTYKQQLINVEMWVSIVVNSISK